MQVAVEDVSIAVPKEDVSIALPKFLVTTVAPKSHVGDKIVFDSKSPEAVGELPVFLVDVKYEDNASVAGKWTQADDEGKGKNWTVDKHGEGKFSGTKVSQEFTRPALAITTTPRPVLALAVYP